MRGYGTDYYKRLTTSWICVAIVLVLICICTMSALPRENAHADSEQKTVKVGWYESSFNRIDDAGRRTGYAYEYQMKIAAYTGWKYSYVVGSWADLLQMLKDGEIDMMSDVSYTDERAEQMLYADSPMGAEDYYIFISPENTEITAEDYATLNGKKIGVNKGSIQIGFYEKWAQQHGVAAELVLLTTTESESIELLLSGELDAYITPNAAMDPARLTPVCKIGYSDYYFVVSQGRADLLQELNSAMNRIHDEDPYYQQRLFEKYVQAYGANAFLTSGEKKWLQNHGVVRVGYQDNFMAFCAKNKNGDLTGALKDYLECAAKCFANGDVTFEAIAYSTAAAAVQGLQNGEVDCVFPSNLGSYDGEKMGIVMTPSITRTDIYAVSRRSNGELVLNGEHVIVAVNEGNPNYDAFLSENYPNWRKVYFSNTIDCLEAVSNGLADCVLISNYRYNNLARVCDKLDLVTYATGIGLDYTFAVREGDTELYSIMAKIVGLVPASTVNAALSYYLTEDSKMTFRDFVADNVVVIVAVISLIILLGSCLVIWSMLKAKKANDLVKVTETDDLTGLYNSDYFFVYANRLYHEHPDVPRDAIVLNIEQFHTLNDFNGRGFGNSILREIGEEVFAIAKELDGIGGRFGADRFDVYCRHTDDYYAIFDRIQNKLNTIVQNDSISIRMGVMPYVENIEPIEQFDRARSACSMARGKYKKRIIVYDDAMHERELRDRKLLGDFRRALDNYEFVVYYQPQYDVSGETPRLVGAESLVRWQHPELGLLLPIDFVPLFEQNGKIFDLDKYVWTETARQIARWRAQFGVTIPVSVNLSRLDIFDPSLTNMLDTIVLKNGLERNLLKLEVTESAYTENADQLIHIVEGLRERGYVIEMDDFGTGYSSLNMLSSLPLDVLKMDRRFIKDIAAKERDVQLAELIIDISKRLGIPVVAEGIETEDQLRILKELGCIYAQGFFFAKPMHSNDFEAEIEKYADSTNE